MLGKRERRRQHSESAVASRRPALRLGTPWFALSAVAFLLAPALALADGMAFKGYDTVSPRIAEQGEQKAVVLHRNGTEKLVIAISLDLEDEDNAVWIFPVPGSPDQVKLDVLNAFPVFHGKDVLQEGRASLRALFPGVRATQIYPLILELGTSAGRMGGVSRHGEVEKWGIHAETVTASSVDDLASYLETKEVRIPSKSLATFDTYLSDEYTLVLAWISSRAELLREFPQYEPQRDRSGELAPRWPSLYVEFPTERAFYPLRATSGYGNTTIPLDVWVVGHVKVDTSVSLAQKLSVSHYVQKSYPKGIPDQFGDALPWKDIPYTRVSIYTAARFLEDDLWFSAGAPIGARYAHAITALSETPVAITLVGLFIVVALSYLSAGLSGLALLGKWRGYARLGFWNVLTLVGLIIAVRRTDSEMWKRADGATAERDAPRMGFCIAFTFTYLILSIILQLILRFPLV